MSDTLDRVKALVAADALRVTDHGDEELAEDRIGLRDVLAGVREAVTIEDYPDAKRGPTVLVLQHDRDNNPIHVLWGIRHGTDGPAVLITAYRPDPSRWSEDFRRRRR